MTLQVIVGGQFGSEGKGAIAAWLAAREKDLIAVRVAGPNAGHTVVGRCPPDCPSRDPGNTLNNVHAPGPDSHPWRLRQVPAAAITNADATLVIAQGSEIDPDVLRGEVEALDAAGYRVSRRLFADWQATVIGQTDKDLESDEYGHGLVSRIGSTGKGIGSARAARAMRKARLAHEVFGLACQVEPVTDWLRSAARAGQRTIQIEGTQGYGLGLHAGHYPYCTSSDCTALDFLAMAGIPPWLVPDGHLQVWVVFRTYPIRVAGRSGPLEHETSWTELGLPEERTTVTNKVRRVGLWDPRLAREAMAANGHRTGQTIVRAALTMADYLVPELAGVSDLGVLDGYVLEKLDLLTAQYSKDIGSLIRLVGTGPGSVLSLDRFQVPGPAEKRAYQVIP